MFDQAIFRTGVKYGVMCALATFAVILILYFTGFNPYGQKKAYSWVLIPVFVFTGIRYFKKFKDQELGFVNGFKVGFSISLYTAVCSGMLMYVFSVMTGIEPIERHIAEMKSYLAESKAVLLKSKVISQADYAVLSKEIENNLEHTTPLDLALDDFGKKMTIGLLSAIVGAVFFRK